VCHNIFRFGERGRTLINSLPKGEGKTEDLLSIVCSIILGCKLGVKFTEGYLEVNSRSIVS
jgi:hypothetical protein